MTISQQVIEIFDYLGEKFGIVIDWGSENVLPYVQELISRIVTYGIIGSVIPCICGLVSLIVAIALTKVCLNKWKVCSTTKEDTSFWEYTTYLTMPNHPTPTFGGIFLITGIVILAILSISLLLWGVFDLIQWIVIPEVPLMELISGFIQGL